MGRSVSDWRAVVETVGRNRSSEMMAKRGVSQYPQEVVAEAAQCAADAVSENAAVDEIERVLIGWEDGRALDLAQ